MIDVNANKTVTLICVTDKKFFNFLKAFANSIRLNTSDIKLVVRVVGFTPSLEDFKQNHYRNTEFIYDNSVLTGGDTYEFDHKSESKINRTDDKSKYCNNIRVMTINSILKRGDKNVIYSDIDCIVQKNISEIFDSFDMDMSLLLVRPNFYHFGFVFMKNNERVREFFTLLDDSLDMSIEQNQNVFNDILKTYGKLRIKDIDSSFISGVNMIQNQYSYIYHAPGWQKYWNTDFRKMFYDYLSKSIESNSSH